MRTRIHPSPLTRRLVRTGAVAALAVAVSAPALVAAAATPSTVVRARTVLPQDRVSTPPNVAFPVVLSGNPVDRRSFVHGRHNGTDIDAPCGTPVVSAIPGTARVQTGQAWAGGTLVKVFATKDHLTTWYGYLRDVAVTDGQLVQAGQPLGEVGNGGNATRCQLHFQVRTNTGKTIRNPSSWMDRYVGKPAPVTLMYGNRGFTLATFNVLGASHTKAGGDAARRYPSYSVRLPKAIRALDTRHVDVVGLQEFQKPQHEMFQNRAGSTYNVYPSSRTMDTENSIAWRRSTFDLVSANRFDVRYFNGSIRKMPYVLLRQRSTGRTAYFINVHNPANTAQYKHQEKWRAEAIAAERELVVRLRATGRPVFLTGDLNDREKAFCPLSAGKLMLAPNSVPSMDCAPPPKPGIDWILAAGPARFATFLQDWSVKDLKITDHPIVTSRAHLAE